jgi:flagellin
MTTINTNVNALFAQNALKVNDRSLTKAMQQLSTGSRINSSGDDAAGLAIGTSMTAQIRGLNMAVRNANDGISMLQTAEGAMVEQTNMLQRMRELAVQATTATYNTTQLGYLDTEFQALDTQINNIASNTKWNGSTVLAPTATKSFVVGSAGSETISVTLTATDTTTLATTSLVVSSASSAATAVTAIDTALASISSARASIGAGINQLTYAADNLTNVSQNLVASRSQIVDTDYATATTQLARSQIIQQAATAMLAQANQQPQSVLALLK